MQAVVYHLRGDKVDAADEREAKPEVQIIASLKQRAVIPTARQFEGSSSDQDHAGSDDGRARGQCSELGGSEVFHWHDAATDYLHSV